MKTFMRVFLVGGGLFLLSFVTAGCGGGGVLNQYSSEDKEFLSTVRYIITNNEKKQFKALPPEKRGEFIEEFWKKRDPDPLTPDNEMKTEYFKRIAEANHTFVEGSKTAGWLTDRGKTYVLFGPPDQRQVYPTGYSFYEPPVEIWYYGFFPIIFVDSSRSGVYKLEPLSARHITEINKAQISIKKGLPVEEKLAEFKVGLKRLGNDKVLLHIELPYKSIWLAKENGLLKTELKLILTASSEDDQKRFWTIQQEYPLSVTEEEIRRVQGVYTIEREVTLEPGAYHLTVEIENLKADTRVKKVMKLKI